MSTKIPEWVNTVLKDKDNQEAVSSILEPRIILLKNPRVTQSISAAGDTVPGLQEISKKCPKIFGYKRVVDSLLEVLRWSSGLSAPRDGIVQHQLTCSLLMAGHEELEVWPISLVQAYLEDASEKRMWVDIPQASVLVSNILTAFPGQSDATSVVSDTKSQSSSKEPDSKRRKIAASESPSLRPTSANSGASASYFNEEGMENLELSSSSGAPAEKSPVRPRFRSAPLQQEIARISLEVVKRCIDPSTSSEANQKRLQNFLRVLSHLVVYEPIRKMVVQKLDFWINNPNLVRYVKEILPRLAVSCLQDSEMERDTMVTLLRMKPKANAIQMHNEAIATICKTNIHFQHVAMYQLMESEMRSGDLQANKALRNMHQISTLFKNAGCALFSTERSPESGSGLERHSVFDFGIGSIQYVVRGKLKTYSPDTLKGDASKDRVVVASESDLFGDNSDAENRDVSRIHDLANKLHSLGAAGLVLIVNSSPKNQNPKSWQPGKLNIPVVVMPASEASVSFMEALRAESYAIMGRTPREVELAFTLKLLAKDADNCDLLPVLLRKVLKCCQSFQGTPELDAVALCKAIMDPVEEMEHEPSEEERSKWAWAMVELVCFVCIFVAGQTVEAVQAPVHADRGNLSSSEQRLDKSMSKFRYQVVRIQEMAILWLSRVLVRYLKGEKFVAAVTKLLFCDKSTSYGSETLVLETQEKAGINRLQSDMAVTETSLLEIASWGRSRPTGFLVEPWLVLDILEKIISRALSIVGKSSPLPSDDGGDNLDNLEISVMGVSIWEVILELCTYANLYPFLKGLAPYERLWQAYVIITILAALNPETLGQVAWSSIPTVRVMLQMLVMRRFCFPPIRTGQGNADEIKSPSHPSSSQKEEEVNEVLQQDLIARNKELAAIDLARQQLQSTNLPEKERFQQLLEISVVVNPTGPARSPPKEKLADLEKLDTKVGLGNILRQSRNPDMLLETIKAHGSDSSCVQWLGDILEVYPSTVEALPAVTICQLLYNHVEQNLGVKRLVTRLARSIKTSTAETWEQDWMGITFFVDFLESIDEGKRKIAVKALDLITSAVTNDAEGSVVPEPNSKTPVEFAAPSSTPPLRSEADTAQASPVLSPEILNQDKQNQQQESWLKALLALDVPDALRENLRSRLLGALFTETDVQLLLDYLLCLRSMQDVISVSLAQEVANFVLKRRVLVTYLSKLEDGAHVLRKTLLEAIQADRKDEMEDESFVKIGDYVMTRDLARAGIHAICLEDEFCMEGTENYEEREKLISILVSDHAALSVLELDYHDLLIMLQSQLQRLVDAALGVCTAQQMVESLSVFGLNVKVLATIVSRLEQSPADVDLKSQIQLGTGARIVRMLSSDFPRESSWLSERLELSYGPPKVLAPPPVDDLLLDFAAHKELAQELDLDVAKKEFPSCLDSLRQAVGGGDLDHLKLEICFPMWSSADGGLLRAVPFWWACRVASLRERSSTWGPVWTLTFEPKEDATQKISAVRKSFCLLPGHLAVDFGSPDHNVLFWRLQGDTSSVTRTFFVGETIMLSSERVKGTIVSINTSGKVSVKKDDGSTCETTMEGLLPLGEEERSNQDAHFHEKLREALEGPKSSGLALQGSNMDLDETDVKSRGVWGELVLDMLRQSRDRRRYGSSCDLLYALNALSMVKGSSDSLGEIVASAFSVGNGTSSRHAVLCSALLQHDRGSGLQACASFLLNHLVFRKPQSAMTFEGSGESTCEGQVDCAMALDVLSACMLGSSRVREGDWGEGGGGEVSETKTRKENSGIGTGLRRLKAEECVTLALLIVCESLANEQRGSIRMGRIQLLLEGVANETCSASAVRDCLLDILTGAHGDSEAGSEGDERGMERGKVDRVDASLELKFAALDLYERLRMSLPLQLSARAAGLPVVAQQELLQIMQELKGDSRKTSSSTALIRQTAKLDRLLQNVLIFLQDKSKAQEAIVVARQIACAHPALIANHMLSIRSLCSGKAMLRLADFVERNGPQLFSHVITILEAAKPFSLNSPALSLVLEEFFFLYASTARREELLKPLLSKFMGLCLSVVKSSSPSAGHVRENVPLLEKLCGWYPDVPELQALLELLNPSSFVKGLGLQELHGASRQVEDISSRLRLRRSIRMIGTGERASEDESSAYRGLTQALEEADALITEEVNLQTLSCLERPLLDLTTARSSSIRILVYRLLLRLARILPESATRIANKHFLCMCSEDDGVQLSATSFASQMVHISAPTAPKVLRKLLAMARGGSKTAEKELMRAVQSGLEYHCLEAR